MTSQVLTIADRYKAAADHEIPPGQFCPYDDCDHYLVIKDLGWIVCGNCKRLLWATDTDSDFEDYHLYRSEKTPNGAGQRPTSLDSVPVAESLGPPGFASEDKEWRSALMLDYRVHKTIPPKMLAGLCDAMGGDVGFFTRCMGHSFGSFNPGDQEAFCAWLHKRCVGKWPSEGRGKKEAMAGPMDRDIWIYKDARTGSWRWVTISSSGYEDRDGELVSTKALADDVERADKSQWYGPLLWWHLPIKLGDCDFNAMYGRLLIESGTFMSETIAKAVQKAARDLGISLGFFRRRDEPGPDGVYTYIRRFERSLLPASKASNRFTTLLVEEVMGMDPIIVRQKLEELVNRLGGDVAESVLAQAGTIHKGAEALAQAGLVRAKESGAGGPGTGQTGTTGGATSTGSAPGNTSGTGTATGGQDSIPSTVNTGTPGTSGTPGTGGTTSGTNTGTTTGNPTGTAGNTTGAALTSDTPLSALTLGQFQAALTAAFQSALTAQPATAQTPPGLANLGSTVEQLTGVIQNLQTAEAKEAGTVRAALKEVATLTASLAADVALLKGEVPQGMFGGPAAGYRPSRDPGTIIKEAGTPGAVNGQIGAGGIGGQGIQGGQGGPGADPLDWFTNFMFHIDPSGNGNGNGGQ